MMSYIKFILVFVGLWMMTVSGVSAQNDRTFIREGNRAYHAKKWAAAETQYRKALSKNSKNSQAIYNLGCALLMQQKDSVAMQQFANASQLETNKMRRAKCYYNMGVIMQGHQQYAQAIDCYKNALRCNPNDDETRYNLALCKKLMKNQSQQNKNDKNKDGKNKDKNKDKQKQNQDQNKNEQNKDKNKDKNNDQDKNKNNNQNQDKNQQNQDKMSKDNAEQLLNAAVQQEKATKQKLQKAMSQPRRNKYAKNW